MSLILPVLRVVENLSLDGQCRPCHVSPRMCDPRTFLMMQITIFIISLETGFTLGLPSRWPVWQGQRQLRLG